MITPSYGQSWYKIYGYAGKTVTWCPSDSEERWNTNMANPDLRARLNEFGWTRDNVSYTFNEDGFRADEFTYHRPHDSVLFLGCSLTIGIGMPLEETWAYKVASSLGLRRYNLGVGGSGSDMCFRLAYHWIPRLRPKYVVMLTPNAARLEILDETENLLYIPSHTANSPFYMRWLLHPANADMNRLKSVMGVQTICNSIGVPLIEVPVEDVIVPRNGERDQSWARDLMHPGNTWNERVTSTIMEKISALTKIEA
jgi:hypothetical protein